MFPILHLLCNYCCIGRCVIFCNHHHPRYSFTGTGVWYSRSICKSFGSTKYAIFLTFYSKLIFMVMCSLWVVGLWKGPQGYKTTGADNSTCDTEDFPWGFTVRQSVGHCLQCLDYFYIEFSPDVKSHMFALIKKTF